MKILCVAEKPSIAKSIAQILSSGNGLQSRPGLDKFCRNFCFRYRMPPGRRLGNLDASGWVDMVVTSVRGHLTNIDFGEEHKKWSACRPTALFDAPVKIFISKDAMKTAQNIKQEARGANVLMIWTDCDREGEHIGAEVVRECKKVNRSLQVVRARFSAIIANQIHQAAQNPVELDWAAASAVEARQELDLRLGAAFTRMQTLVLQRQFEELDKKVISYGPCQFPTLGFVVDQYSKVMEFVPKPFWYIYVMHKRSGIEVVFRWARNHLFAKEEVQRIFDMCKRSSEARVIKVTKKQTKKFKPKPLTTVELQKSGGRLLHIAPKRILDISEKLYNRGLLSYPRTETDQYDRQFDFRALIARQVNDRDWGSYAGQLMDSEGKFENPRNGQKNDKAHPPIHPTSHANDLSGDDKRVYEYVTRRFLASCSKDAMGQETKIDIHITEELFSASGIVVQQRNFLDVFPYESWGGPGLPVYNEGEQFKPTELSMKEGETTRPKLLTEADLVSLMDKNGIGTDATIAEHIAKIIEREYVFVQPEGKIKYLVPSTLGMGLVMGYNRITFEGNKSLCKPLLRKATEDAMTLICDGQRTKAETIQESLHEYLGVFVQAENNIIKVTQRVGHYLRGDALPEEDSGYAAHISDIDGQDLLHGLDDIDDGDNHDSRPGGDVIGGEEALFRGRRNEEAVVRPPLNEVEIIEIDDDEDLSLSPPLASQEGRELGPSTSASNIPLAISPDPEEINGAAPTCNCGLPAAQRTVTKDSANKGRVFWRCAKPPGDQSDCGFFEWCTSPNTDSGVSFHRSTSGSVSRSTASLANTEAADRYRRLLEGSTLSRSAMIPRCRCDLEAKRAQVNKEGANKGRFFWTCPNISVTAQCGFFEWDEESSTSIGENNNSGRGSCFTCGASGHWAQDCPNPSDGSGSGSGVASTSRNGQQTSRGRIATSGSSGPRANATSNGGSTSTRKGSCFLCGQEGHWSSECTEDQSSSSNSMLRGRGKGRRRGASRGEGSSSRKKRRYS